MRAAEAKVFMGWMCANDELRITDFDSDHIGELDTSPFRVK